MKKLLVQICLMFLLGPSGLRGQIALSSLPLEITYSKTTSIVFPFAIKSVDRGSPDILMQKAGGVENVLQLKAARKEFKPTSLTVITADGRLFSFNVTYTDEPAVLNLSFVEDGDRAALFEGAEIDEAQTKFDTQVIAVAAKKNSNRSDKCLGVRVQLAGFYVRGKVIYCRLRISNSSQLDYDVDQIRFSIKERKRARRTASQERALKPYHIENDVQVVKAGTEEVVVYALPKVTIPAERFLRLEVMERSGGRNLACKISNRYLLKAEPMRELLGEEI